MSRIENIAGKICEILLPIRDTIYIGNGSSIAVCTLASIDLLKSIARDEHLMHKIAVVGRLLSENKGIDMLLDYIASMKGIRYLIICGKDSRGHYAGQALIALHRNGMDERGRIIGAIGKNPVISASIEKVNEFRIRVNVIDMIGVVEKERISLHIESLGVYP